MIFQVNPSTTCSFTEVIGLSNYKISYEVIQTIVLAQKRGQILFKGRKDEERERKRGTYACMWFPNWIDV